MKEFQTLLTSISSLKLPWTKARVKKRPSASVQCHVLIERCWEGFDRLPLNFRTVCQHWSDGKSLSRSLTHRRTCVFDFWPDGVLEVWCTVTCLSSPHYSFVSLSGSETAPSYWKTQTKNTATDRCCIRTSTHPRLFHFENSRLVLLWTEWLLLILSLCVGKGECF